LLCVSGSAEGDAALDGPASTVGAEGAALVAGLWRGEAGAEERSESESDMVTQAENGMTGETLGRRIEGLIVKCSQPVSRLNESDGASMW